MPCNTYPNTHLYSNSYSDCDGYRNSNRNTGSNTGNHCDTICYRYPARNRHGDSARDSNGDRDRSSLCYTERRTYRDINPGFAPR
jgi:hypothetical protein